jgi:hypothetical protein
MQNNPELINFATYNRSMRVLLHRWASFEIK